jgi:hypothetical protein
MRTGCTNWAATPPGRSRSSRPRSAGGPGRPVPYRALSYEAYLAFLTSAGLPGPAAELIVGADASIARGELARTNGDLSRLIGRPTTPMPWSVAQAMRGLVGAPGGPSHMRGH